jgi:hypothetical protein
MAHFTFLAFKFLTLWLSYIDVMLANCKLEISQTMSSWGKLSVTPQVSTLPGNATPTLNIFEDHDKTIKFSRVSFG